MSITQAELEAVVSELFTALDKDNSGFLEKAEVHQIAHTMHQNHGAGEPFNEELFEKGFTLLDKSGDGKISKEELLVWAVQAAQKRGIIA